MNSLKVRLKTLTPLFMAGGNQQSFEWRSFSVKGLLRWWYRAAGGTQLQEGWLFGQSLQQPSLASGVIVRANLEKGSPRSSKEFEKAVPGYFAFPFKLKGGERMGLPPGSELSIELHFDSRLDADKRQDIQSALWLMCHLGNVGYRSRKGFGSVLPIESPDRNWFTPEQILKSHKTFQEAIYAHIRRLKQRKPRILYVYLARNTWSEIAELYKNTRRQLKTAYKGMLGYPIFKQAPIYRNLDRFASPLIIKPIHTQWTLVTILNIPTSVKKEVKKLVPHEAEPGIIFGRILKENFISKLKNPVPLFENR